VWTSARRGGRGRPDALWCKLRGANAWTVENMAEILRHRRLLSWVKYFAVSCGLWEAIGRDFIDPRGELRDD
jgi:hypothetical protein